MQFKLAGKIPRTWISVMKTIALLYVLIPEFKFVL